MEFFLRLLQLSNIINVILFFSVLFFVIKYLIPTYFSKKNEARPQDFDALIRQKKIELTSMDTDLEGIQFSKPTKSKDDFLGYLGEKFPHQQKFYQSLERNAGWQESVVSKNFQEHYPQFLQFDMQWLDVKKILLNTNYEIVHRGDYQKVLLLIWIEKLIHCLAINQSLPSPPNIMVSCELPLWRWALLRISLGVGAWQESIFDNQSLVFDKRSEILSTKNLQDYVKNSKAWWEKITNYIYQIEAFYPLEESDLLRLEKSSLSKKEKLQFLKRYHPDMIDWDLIDHSLRSNYEALIQNNFIKINEKIHT